MAKRKFTEEQQSILRGNQYTLSVSANLIRFTPAFKKYLVEEMAKSGMTLKKVFIKAGYDPDMLGVGRMDSVIKEARDEAASPCGFHETGKSTRTIIKEELSKKNTKASIQALQKQVAYLEQEVEFLKKTLQLPPIDEADR